MFDLGILVGLEGIGRLGTDLAKMNAQIGSSVATANKTVGGLKGAFQDLTAEIPLLGKAFRVLTNPITLLATAITAVGIGFGSALSTAKTFEKQIADTAAIVTAGFDTKKAQVQIQALEQEALRLGSSTEFTATQAAKAFEFLGRAGFDTQQILAGAADALSLATVGNLDLGRAADISSNVLTQFNKDAAELGSVVDGIAKVTTTSNTNVEQFAEAMKFLGPTAAALKVPFEEASAAVGVLANSGLQGSLGTRALGTALTRLTAPIPKVQDAIRNLGIEAFDSQGQFVGIAGLISELEKAFVGFNDKQRQSALTTIFGAEAIQEFNILLSAGSAELAQYTEEVGRATAQNGEFAKGIRDAKLDNLEGALISIRSAFEGFQISVAKPFLDGFKDIGFAVADFIRLGTAFVTGAANLSTGLVTIGDETKTFGEAFGSVGAAVQGVLTFIEPVRDAFASLIQDLEPTREAISSLFDGLENIGTGTISGILSIGEQIGDTLLPTFQLISGAISGLINSLAGLGTQIVNALRPVFGALIGDGTTIASVIGTSIVGAINIFAQAVAFSVRIATDLVNVFSDIIEFVSDNEIAFGALVGTIVAYNFNTLTAIGQTALLGAKMFITNGLASAGALIHGALSTAIALLTGKISLATIAQTALNFVLTANPIGLVIVAVGALVGAFVALYRNSETVRAGVAGTFAAIKAVIQTTINALKDQLFGFGNIIAGVFTFDLDRIKSGLSQFADGVKGQFGGVGEAAREAFVAGYDNKLAQEAGEKAAKAGRLAADEFQKASNQKLIDDAAGSLSAVNAFNLQIDGREAEAAFATTQKAAKGTEDAVKGASDAVNNFGQNINTKPAQNSIAGLEQQIRDLETAIQNSDPRSSGFSNLVKASEEAEQALTRTRAEVDRIRNFGDVGIFDLPLVTSASREIEKAAAQVAEIEGTRRLDIEVISPEIPDFSQTQTLRIDYEVGQPELVNIPEFQTSRIDYFVSNPDLVLIPENQTSRIDYIVNNPALVDIPEVQTSEIQYLVNNPNLVDIPEFQTSNIDYIVNNRALIDIPEVQTSEIKYLVNNPALVDIPEIQTSRINYVVNNPALIEVPDFQTSRIDYQVNNPDLVDIPAFQTTEIDYIVSNPNLVDIPEFQRSEIEYVTNNPALVEVPAVQTSQINYIVDNPSLVDVPDFQRSEIEYIVNNPNLVDIPAFQESRIDYIVNDSDLISIPDIQVSEIDYIVNNPALVDIPETQTSRIDYLVNNPSLVDIPEVQTSRIDYIVNNPALVNVPEFQRSEIEYVVNNPALVSVPEVQTSQINYLVENPDLISVPPVQESTIKYNVEALSLPEVPDSKEIDISFALGGLSLPSASGIEVPVDFDVSELRIPQPGPIRIDVDIPDLSRLDTLNTLGTLEDITLGINIDAPDLPSFEDQEVNVDYIAETASLPELSDITVGVNFEPNLEIPDLEPLSNAFEFTKEVEGLSELNLAAAVLGVNAETINKNFSSSAELFAAMETGAYALGEALTGNADAALSLIDNIQQLGEALQDTLINGAVRAFQTFGREIGKAIATGAKFKDAFQAFLQAIAATLLVEVPKLIGVFLLQTGVGLGYPAGIPAIIAGIALVAFSGVAAGLLEGGKGGSTTANTNADFSGTPGSSTGGISGGLSSQGSERREDNITNVTVELNTDGIVEKIQEQQIINGELRDG